MQSPQFFYRPEGLERTPDSSGNLRLDPWEIAQALSFGIISALPDSELIKLATFGELLKISVIKDQVRRLFGLPAARDSLWKFYQAWLGIPAPERIPKDPVLYSKFTAVLAQSAQAETKAFVLSAVFDSNGGWIQKILTGARGDRKGVHNMCAFLMANGGNSESKPPHLGKYILRTTACLNVPPTPPNVTKEPFTVDPTKSLRDNFERRMSVSPCSACHVTLNGVGFPFDRYDTVGEPRSMIQRFLVVTSGKTRLPSGSDL